MVPDMKADCSVPLKYLVYYLLFKASIEYVALELHYMKHNINSFWSCEAHQENSQGHIFVLIRPIQYVQVFSGLLVTVIRSNVFLVLKCIHSNKRH